MNDEFRHERLKLPGGFMRLLQIQGNTGGGGGGGSGVGVVNISSISNNTPKDTISLRITQYAIHRLPRYVAISYTWGSALMTRPIRVNGRPFYVRLNLWHLLWHLRQRGESRFLWIDALCIDQKNLEERNFHVQLMGNIYDKAVVAIVWLGLPSDDRRQARVLEFIAEMSAFGRAKHGGKGVVLDETDMLTMFRHQFLTETSTQRWLNVLELCKGTYWTRTWIIQEFLQASQVQVLCGTASLEWACFEDVVRKMRKILTAASHEQHQQQPKQQKQQAALPSFVTQFMQTLPVRLTIRRIFHTSSTLEELISEFYDSRCAERRDKIYGILGIADDCGERVEPPENAVVRIGPKPDYSQHIMDVYFGVFDYLLSPASPGSSPLQAIYLTQKSLGLSENDLVSYVDSLSRQNQQRARGQDTDAALSDLEVRLFRSKLPLRPDYINVISEVLPGWTSMRDLRQRLEQVDWARYVGHEVKRKPLGAARLSSSGSGSGPGSGLTPTPTTTPQRRKSSSNAASIELGFDTATAATGSSPSGTSTPTATGRPVRAPLPENMLDNVVYMADHAHDTLHALYNYCAEPASDSRSSTTPIPLSHIQLSPHEKRAHLNPTLAKPSIIIESCPAKGVGPVRIGFACTEARAGDLVCQFNGLEQTLVVRRGDAAGGGGPGVSLVGLARMVSHPGLRERGVHPAAVRTPGLMGWSGCVLPPSPPSPPPMDQESGEASAVVVVDLPAAGHDGDAYNYTVDMDPVSWWEVLR
ncbi:uncharacterized protein A1O9_03916 [Exophiala aquamarina CBS 119918]|uniref:Heterokaryon incompatibility domain-containing protein n=1 Tax=Exophiala aquamarina CBS 119918 TaxID=1182545 RepID=A0A072PIC4_9EURO|nr:uncharacterized protein A1O9_03916 [Exophiala aquamarina CBS 119918]KEF59073.1 hypothetical protein A1O9_03916 [Exophiala aquamarina CBS 119918]